MAAVLAGVATSGCSTEAYCFVCPSQETPAGGSGGGVGTGATSGFMLQDSGAPDSGGDGGGAGMAACADTQSDTQNCGECGTVCSVPGAFPKCVGGVCVVDTCASGFVDLNGDGARKNSDGCECQLSGDGKELCDNVDNNCDGKIDEGFDLQTDIDNCGVCNSPCPDLPHATKACVSGQCQYACEAGFANPGGGQTSGCLYQCPVFPPVVETCNGTDDDCDGAIDNGQPGAGVDCSNNCPNGVCRGECKPGKTACTSTGSTLVCIGGVGPTGELCDGLDNNCDGSIDEGFDTSTDPLNCGSCGVHCAVGDKCLSGQCQYQCSPGFKDLDGDPSNRCEYACPVFPVKAETCNGSDDDCNGVIDDSPSDVGGACAADCPSVDACVTSGNCSPYVIAPKSGSCYGVCAAPGSKICSGGLLVCAHPSQALIETCNGLDDNCNGVVDEGFDLQNDPFNCGSCGSLCKRPNTLAMACNNGACSAIVSCQPGFSNLDGDPSNGCEYTCPVNPAVSEVCNGQDDDCNGVIDDFVSGFGQSCAASCPAAAPCIAAGNCSLPVSPQVAGCYGACASDGVTSCVSGSFACLHPAKAAEVCNDQDDDCDGLVDNGLDKQTDIANCGSCGHICSLPSTTSHTCVAGTCQVLACDPGYASIDGNAANGCEYKCPVYPTLAETCNGKDDDCDGVIDDSPSGVGVSCQANCPGGTCKGACTAGTSNCVGGALVCQGGQGPTLEVCDGVDNNCDGTKDEGFNTNTDPNNCGACGTVCSVPNAIPGCAAGACTIAACKAGFGNPDGLTANGCEQTCAVYPTTTEVCNGKDDDCDGLVDNADPSLQTVSNFCVQTGPCAGAAPTCQGSNGWRCNYGAIDSRIQTQSNGSLAASETLCDSFDNNCNGQTDETFPNKGKPCTVGTGICAGAASFACSVDQLTTSCPATATPDKAVDEICNGLDDNCDGQIDERVPTVPAGGPITCKNGPDHPCKGWTDPMVKVGGSVWMYSYEASRPDAATTNISGARACSNPAVLPWTSLAWIDADAACKAVKDSTGAPLRLCSQAEWDTGCFSTNSGFPIWSYGTTPSTYTAGRCNDVDPATPVGTWVTAFSPQCFSDWGAAGKLWDMSGNVSEWTNTCVALNGKTYCNVQGGNSQTLANGTVCGFDFVLQQQTFANFDLGFRCCSDHAP